MSAYSVINEKVGYNGRLLNMDKRCPKGHVCVWNANIVVDGLKVWYGDLDLTADEASLQAVADEIKEPLYILYEMDGRFDNEGEPKVDNAIKVFKPTA